MARTGQFRGSVVTAFLTLLFAVPWSLTLLQTIGAAEPPVAPAPPGPRLANRDALRIRLANKPPVATTVQGDAPEMYPGAGDALGESRELSDPYPSNRLAGPVTVDGMMFAQRPIGLDIVQAAAASGAGRTPENFAQQVLPQDQKIDVTHASRYREDFVVPVDLTAGEFCYRPLYFQEVNLERYGTSHGFWQPVISGARFFATVPALPYLMTVHRPCVCRYWPHQFPAGRKAPCWEKEGPPFDLEAAGIEGLAVYGLILLIP